MEKYFNPEETYDKAIREREKGVLRALLTGIIGSDPTFVTTEFDEALEYIKKKSTDYHGEELILTEEYQKQEDEYEKETEEWDERYFQMNLVWLRDNFCLSKRLPLIKEIGKIVYKNKNTLGKSKAESRCRAVTESSINRPVRPDSKKGEAVRTTGGGREKKSLKKGEAVRTAGGGRDKKSRLSGSLLNIIKGYWWVALIVLVLIALVIIGVIVLGKN